MDRKTHYILAGPFSPDELKSNLGHTFADHAVETRDLGQLAPAPVTEDLDLITMTLTRYEWRILAVAAAKLSEKQIMNGELAVPSLRRLSSQIAVETGKTR